MTTQSADERLGEIVKGLMSIRGWSSPEAAEKSYLPDDSPVGRGPIGHIIKGDWGQHETKRGRFTMMRLSVMLQTPPTTLELVYKGDVAGIRRLEFDGRESVRQFVLDAMKPPTAKSRKAALPPLRQVGRD